MRVLMFDLETLPGLAYFWQAKTDWIGPHMVVHEPFLLSYVAKWQDSKRVYTGILTPAEIANRDDARITAEIADLLRSADKVVAHNGDSFDLPIVRGRLLVNNLEPLGMVQSIDTLKLAKKSFRQTHNNLNSLAEALGVEGKLSTGGFGLWEACYRGDEKALAKMLRYNRKDVLVLQDVYERLVRHARGVPRLVDADFANERKCTQCGSESVRKDGTYRTNAGAYPRWRCNDCGACMRERSAIKGERLAYVPLP